MTGEEGLGAAYEKVRAQTGQLCAPLQVEDHVVQSMPEASPAKWHLAHTTWFFEAFILEPACPGYRPFHPDFNYLFNSYYNAAGERLPRPRRGLLTRPSVGEVYRYRAHVDAAMRRLLRAPSPLVAERTALGLNHEQQHQELLLTDLKHAFFGNPLRPAYREAGMVAARPGGWADTPAKLRWLAYPAGLRWLGHAGPGFAYDNEGPRHQAFVHTFELASRLVTNGEFRTFAEDGGYRRPELWLSDGWAARQAQGWSAPLYWEPRGGRDWHFTLDGMAPLEEHAPVCHVSYYEADAYARWAGARLPTEAEWEAAALDCPVAGTFLDSGRLRPATAPAEEAGPVQMFGDVWQWTSSPYVGYPGYRPPEGALGEYNGKFMCNQFVLRGGSCATPAGHVRRTYRNFFPPDARWQFAGLRLARD
jgi:ergothioneine biosynthesis protein EgtB